MRCSSQDYVLYDIDPFKESNSLGNIYRCVYEHEPRNHEHYYNFYRQMTMEDVHTIALSEDKWRARCQIT